MIQQETKPAPWWYGPLIAILVFAALGFAGTKDYQDAERQHEVYCSMVEQNAWPDFKRLHEKGECND